ncbi:MAG TPA: hypothetical protein VFU72_02455 [Nitrolancea sp.]|nr:hypothetical protein [Nitrolancea sp.]
MWYVRRVVKGLGIAYGLTLANLLPLFLIHILLPPVAPLIGGYMAGAVEMLGPNESLALGLLSGALVGLPLPIAYSVFGIMGYLTPLAIYFMAGFSALYCGFTIGGLAWIAGDAARRHQRELAEARGS